MTDLREQLARRHAARKCSVKDRSGETLPDELWQQALPHVDATLRDLAACEYRATDLHHAMSEAELNDE